MSEALSKLATKSFRSGVLWYNFLLYFILLSQFPWGINATLFEILHLVPYLLAKRKLLPITALKIGLALVLSVLFWNRADLGFQFLSLFAIAALNFFIFYEVIHKKAFDVDDIVSLVQIKLRNIFRNLEALFSPPNIIPKKANISSEGRRVLLGVIISVPFIFALLMLFSSADSTFEKWTGDFWRLLEKLPNLDFLRFEIWELLFSGFIFTSYILTVIPTENIKVHGLPKKYLIELITLASIVVLIFAIFLVSQFQNIQAILQGFQSATINPREFVREGFYQMSIASGLAFFVLYMLEQNMDRNEKGSSIKAAKLIATVLLFEVLAVITLAFQRVWAYQYAYGYTQLRIWGILLVAWLMGFAVIFGARLYKSISSNQFVQATIFFTTIIVLVSGLINVDKVVATVKPPTVNGKVDYFYLGNLSYDAAPVWQEILSEISPGEEDLINGILMHEGVYMYPNPDGHYEAIYDMGKTSSRYYCRDKSSVLGYNAAVEKGKKIVCENINQWEQLYKEYLEKKSQ